MSPSLVSEFRGSHWYGVGKTKVTLGPFTGGINKARDSNFLTPNELQECINYIIRPDGRLVGRPPVKAYGTVQGLPASFNVSIIGSANSGSIRLGTAFNGPVVFDTNGLRAFIYNPTTDTWGFFSGAMPAGVTNLYSYAGQYAIGWDNGANNNKLVQLGSVTTTNIAAFTTAANVAVGAGTPLVNPVLLYLKSRAVVVANGVIMWSKATDYTTWAVPDGGFSLGIGDAVGGSFIFQDAIYTIGDSGIWRFTWVSDPSIDGSVEHIFSDSVFGAVVYNNEMYIATATGIFKYLNGFLVEVSQAISYDWINRVKALTGSAQPTLSIMEDFLVAGPFGTTTQFYYAYSLKTQTWTSWQLGSGSNAVRGPAPYNGPVVDSGTAYNLGVKKWLWTANGTPYSIPADGLTGGTIYGGYDTNAAGNNFWMGFKFTTAEIDLGDGLRWKRVFRSLIDALYTTVVFTVGTSKINLLMDGVVNTLTPPDNGKLSWGKSFRAKKVTLQYDSTGNTIGTATTPAVELNNIDRIGIYIRVAEEVST